MKWLKNTWDWFSGKKMALGALMLVASKHIPPDKTAHIILSAVGEFLSIGGAVHKFGKSKLPSGLKAKVNQLKSLAKRK